MTTFDAQELKRRAAAGEADNEETTLAQRLEERLGMQQAERERQLRERAKSRASILGGLEDDDLVKVVELATAAAAWCATHDAAVEARRDYLFYRGILAGCAERDAAAVEAAFTTEGDTTAAEAAQALRGLKDEAINDLLEAYREAKRTVNRAAAAYRAAQNGKKPGRTRKPRRIVPDGCYNAAEVARIVSASSSKIVWDWVKRWDTKSGWIPTGFHWPIPRTQQSANELLKMRKSLEAHNKEIQKRKKLREELGESTPRKTPKPRKAGNPELLGEQDEDAEEDTED